MTDSNPTYSVVVPVYNEEENVAELLSQIEAALEPLGDPYEVVFVDDGSCDRSLEVMRELKSSHPSLRVLKLARNTGQSAAMEAGIRNALGAVVITMDADLQNDPADIPKLLEKMDEADAVIGWRGIRKDSMLKRFTSRTGNAIRNWLTHEKVIDTGCSLKAFKRESLSRIKIFRGMHRFLPTLIRMEGCTFTQVRVNHRPRIHGETKYGFFDRLKETTFDVLAVRWMQKRALRYEVSEVAGKEGESDG